MANEYIRHRLENWARWCQQIDSGGLGYPSQSAFTRLGGKGCRSETTINISSIDAGEIDVAVKSLRFTQSHLYLVLTLTYAKGLPRHMVARKMGRTERTITAYMKDAEWAIDRWLQDKRAMLEAAKQQSMAKKLIDQP